MRFWLVIHMINPESKAISPAIFETWNASHFSICHQEKMLQLACVVLGFHMTRSWGV